MQFTAAVDEVSEYGVGETWRVAVSDLQQSLANLYLRLLGASKLGADLEQVRARLQEFIERRDDEQQ